MTWTLATNLPRLDAGPAVFKHGSKQLAVFRVGDDVYAVDNRCPHEGYPLAEGTVDADSCLLTCNWHNWKFQLTDGKCVLGGDNVRRYDVKLDGNDVLVDLSDPPPEEIRASVLDGLRIAFDEQDFGRICREITRLHFNKLDPVDAVRSAIDWSYDRFEFGSTHAFAGSADWLDLYQRFAGDWELQLVCLAETVDHISFDSLRHKAYPFTLAGESKFETSAFVAAVEAEDRETAESMIDAAVTSGLTWDDLEPGFAEAAIAHYQDFGHSLIYVYKTRQMVERLGESVTWPLALALARSLCYATREDLIPQFQAYGPAVERLTQRESAESGNGDELIAPFPASIKDTIGWVEENFESSAPLQIYDAMLRVLGQNLLYYDFGYDQAYEKPVSQSAGWLSVTHGITFANAGRILCEKHPQLWPRLLLQMACFIGRNHGFLDLEQDVRMWDEDPDTFFKENWANILDHGLRAPIFAVHLLKTTVAVEEEISAATAETGRILLAAVNRFLHSPIKQKHTRRLARQAIDLVQRDFKQVD